MKLLKNLRACNTVESTGLVLHVRIEIRPEFDKEEGVLRALVVELLETALLLREFVVDLSHINGLQQWIRIGNGGPANVNKEMPLVLQHKNKQLKKTLKEWLQVCTSSLLPTDSSRLVDSIKAENSTNRNLCVAIARPSHGGGGGACNAPTSPLDTAVAGFPPG